MSVSKTSVEFNACNIYIIFYLFRLIWALLHYTTTQGKNLDSTAMSVKYNQFSPILNFMSHEGC